MALNIPLIRRIIRWIRAHPEEYDQEGCSRCIGALGYYLGNNIPRKQWNNHPAGLSRGANNAEKLMRLSPYHGLFVAYPNEWWPAPYATQWRKATSKKKRARVAVRRLEHLIKTGE